MDATDKFHAERMPLAFHIIHDDSGPFVYVFVAECFADRTDQFRFVGAALEIHYMIPELSLYKSGISSFARHLLIHGTVSQIEPLRGQIFS